MTIFAHWTRALALLVASSTLSCGGPAQSMQAPSTPPANRSDPSSTHTASSLVVALRLLADDSDPDARVRLMAVVYDADGREVAADLGDYTAATVADLPPLGDDLIHVRVEHEGGDREIHIFRRGQFVEARTGVSEESLLLDRIPIPAASILRARDPAIER